jgi:hypothetical protein
MKIAILNGNNQVVRTLTGPGKQGINRIHWDLRHEFPAEVKLRTRPAHNPLVWEEKRFRENARQGWIPLLSWGIEGGLTGPLAKPGEYTVRLETGGQVFTQKLAVLKDPHSTGSIADIRLQVQRALDIRDNLDTVIREINRIEWIRKQLADMMALLKAESGTENIRLEAQKLDDKMFFVESLFFQPVLAEGDEKSFRAPNKLYSQLALLMSDIANDSADFRPTDQQIEVHELLKSELLEAQAKLEKLITEDMATFNRLLSGQNLSGLMVPKG